MGYYSRFYYEENGDDLSQEVIGYLEENRDVDEGIYVLLYSLDEETKFYEYKEVMVELSKRFPDKTFMVHREGENQGDLERSYFVNGKVADYIPELLWPEFCEEDLGELN